MKSASGCFFNRFVGSQVVGKADHDFSHENDKGAAHKAITYILLFLYFHRQRFEKKY